MVRPSHLYFHQTAKGQLCHGHTSMAFLRAHRGNRIGPKCRSVFLRTAACTGRSCSGSLRVACFQPSLRLEKSAFATEPAEFFTRRGVQVRRNKPAVNHWAFIAVGSMSLGNGRGPLYRGLVLELPSAAATFLHMAAPLSPPALRNKLKHLQSPVLLKQVPDPAGGGAGTWTFANAQGVLELEVDFKPVTGPFCCSSEEAAIHKRSGLQSTPEFTDYFLQRCSGPDEAIVKARVCSGKLNPNQNYWVFTCDTDCLPGELETFDTPEEAMAMFLNTTEPAFIREWDEIEDQKIAEVYTQIFTRQQS